MAAKRYIVWDESGGLLSGPHNSSGKAEQVAAKERVKCARICGTDGEESAPGKGDFACGVLSPHGIHIQITEGDRDVTGDLDY
jgi:hypothetical protein